MRKKNIFMMRKKIMNFIFVESSLKMSTIYVNNILERNWGGRFGVGIMAWIRYVVAWIRHFLDKILWIENCYPKFCIFWWFLISNVMLVVVLLPTPTYGHLQKSLGNRVARSVSRYGSILLGGSYILLLTPLDSA
jgi:hypothetical protein